MNLTMMALKFQPSVDNFNVYKMVFDITSSVEVDVDIPSIIFDQ